MYKKILDYNFITKTPSTKYSVEVGRLIKDFKA